MNLIEKAKIGLNPIYLLFALIFVTLPAQSFSSEEALHAEFEKFTGDFDEILEKRHLRALVVYNKILYFLDGPQQRGGTYDILEQFRQFIDKKYETGSRKFQVIYIPVTRENLLPYLNEGIGDIAVANLTITEERLKDVDFTDPLLTGVKEIVVTGPAGEDVNALEDLAGKEVHVRESSSYYTHLNLMNQKFEANGLEPIKIVTVDEFLEDSDLLEMVNAGLLPMVVVDDHKAKFWADIFENLKLHEDVSITVEGSIGWAIRKDSPQLMEVANAFIAENKKGSLIGNTIFKRYLKENKWARNALENDAIERAGSMAELFQKYADEYTFDWLMLLALGFQESGLDQNVQSHVGAIGVMQVLESTASDPNVDVNNIRELENNIHAGTKYLRFLRDRYFSDPEISPLNQTLLSFAAYNAGPAKIRRIRNKTAENGLDPNVWFGNVEHVVAKEIGRETVQYVSHIYKYFIAYRILFDQREDRLKAKEELKEELE